MDGTHVQFGAHNPLNLSRLLEDREYEIITDINLLEAGDIMFYLKENEYTVHHVDTFFEYNENTGEILIYNAGNTEGIQADGPVSNSLDWYKTQTWYAIRLPNK